MKILDLFCIFILSFATLTLTNALTRNFNEGKYKVSWQIDPEFRDQIIFDVIVESTGFIGLGFSYTGSMTGSDIVVGGVRNGLGYLEDRYGIGMQMPLLDNSQDYVLLDASENSTHTQLKFSRKLDTCDENDIAITNDTIKLMWSFGETDDLSYHGSNRGSFSVNLLDPVLIEEPDLSMYKVWELRTNKTMPADHTTYWCTMHKSPELPSVHHIVGFNAIIESSAGLKHTHHMEAYKCDVPAGMEDIFESYLGKEGIDCYYPDDENFPKEHCESIAYGWAIGGELTMFPPKLGFPIVAGDYYKLEVHYDNPQNLVDVHFETGMKLYYTDELREIEAARFVIGSEVNFTQTLPPNTKDFTTVSHCHSSCTNEFPEAGITLFNFLMHSHLSGRTMKVRHFRNGTELPWITKDDNYDFNFQATRSFQSELVLQRGDHLTLECKYDTTWKNGEAVIGGRATRDEMCMVFFSYYPAMDSIASCNSEYPKTELMDFIGLSEVYFPRPGDTDPIVMSPLPLKGLKYSKVIEMISWSPGVVREYQERVRYTPHTGYCRAGGPNFITSYPDFEEEYVPPVTCPAKHI